MAQAKINKKGWPVSYARLNCSGWSASQNAGQVDLIRTTSFDLDKKNGGCGFVVGSLVCARGPRLPEYLEDRPTAIYRVLTGCAKTLQQTLVLGHILAMTTYA